MSKSVLTQDDINLLKNSEEPKNIDLYGNLYKSICNLTSSKAITLENLTDLDDKGKAALTYNKKTLIKTVIKEWYAERVSEEDPSKKVRCGLCNTPNKYLYFIRNRKNNILLNVGSHCITKFPGIEGYIEQKQQLSQIHRGHKIVFRRNEFYTHFNNVENIISEANEFFDTLPILLPYELYTSLYDTITRMRLIYIKYVNEGKKPFKSVMDSFELFNLAIQQYKKLKEQADSHVCLYENCELICKRREIDWLLSNNKEILLKRISKNNGFYDIDTLGYICSLDFIKEYSEIIFAKNISTFFRFERFGENNIIFSFNKQGYHPPILFSVNLSDFMYDIGRFCIFYSDYTFGNKTILKVTSIINSKQNLQAVINFIYDTVHRLNCIFLIDEDANALILYRKGDKALRKFHIYEFLLSYTEHILSSDENIKNYLFSIIKGNKKTKWITMEEQEKQGIDDRIKKLFIDQYDNNQLFNYIYKNHDKYIELIMYDAKYNSVQKNATIDFNNPTYMKFPRSKIKLSDKSLKQIKYAVHISDNSLKPYYHANDIILVTNSQNVKNGNLIFYIASDSFFIKKCQTVKEYENIFDHINIDKVLLKSCGRIVYCLYKYKNDSYE